jgi:hypothetical protein
MWYLKLLQRIDSGVIGRFVSDKQQIIENTNPNRIYVENVRSFFQVPTAVAKHLCEVAVRTSVFEKFIAVECPNEDRIIKSYRSEKEIEEVIKCASCELKGEERFEFKKTECKRIEYYKLVD